MIGLLCKKSVIHAQAPLIASRLAFYTSTGRGGRRGEGRREKGEGRREKGEGRREKGEGRRGCFRMKDAH
jgi:hypothetical protein